MSDLLMDLVTNDMQIVNGDLSFAQGTREIQQNWQQRLQVWLGEWFLDTTRGLPYKQQILVKNPNLDIIQALLLNESKDTPGITNILDFSFDYDPVNRGLSVFMEAETSTGETISVQTTVALPTNLSIEGSPT